MIATGYPYDDGKNTEVIDVEDANFRCTNVEQFPVKLYAASGGLIDGQTPYICGGSNWAISKHCYQLSKTGSWAKDQTATLTTAREYAGYGSVVMDNHLVLTGGLGDENGNKLTSIEMLSTNAKARTLSVELPTGIRSHCQVPWDSEKFLVIGGSGSGDRKETYFINVKTNQLTNGPSLNIPRRSHACGQLDIDGTSYIIVAGGEQQHTEFLDKNNVGQGWQLDW